MKFGSASVPIYQCKDGNSTRFILSYHRNGKRMRQSFCSLPAAKKEALLVAQRIQKGLQHLTDMTPSDRDAYAAAKKMLEDSGTGIPLVAAIEDYLRARAIATAGLKSEPLPIILGKEDEERYAPSGPHNPECPGSCLRRLSPRLSSSIAQLSTEFHENSTGLPLNHRDCSRLL